jgi:hypothetical protein
VGWCTCAEAAAVDWVHVAAWSGTCHLAPARGPPLRSRGAERIAGCGRCRWRPRLSCGPHGRGTSPRHSGAWPMRCFPRTVSAHRGWLPAGVRTGLSGSPVSRCISPPARAREGKTRAVRWVRDPKRLGNLPTPVVLQAILARASATGRQCTTTRSTVSLPWRPPRARGGIPTRVAVAPGGLGNSGRRSVQAVLLTPPCVDCVVSHPSNLPRRGIGVDRPARLAQHGSLTGHRFTTTSVSTCHVRVPHAGAHCVVVSSDPHRPECSVGITRTRWRAALPRLPSRFRGACDRAPRGH